MKLSFLKKINQKADFSNGVETLSEGTQLGIENTIKQFSKFCVEQGSSLEEAIDEMKVAQSKKDVLKALQTWVNWLKNRGLSNGTIPIYFSHLRTYLYYHGVQVTDQERKREIKYPKITEDEKHGLSIDEIKGVLETANQKRKALYLMLLSSGLRIGEAVQLKKKDLVLVGNNFMITVRGKTTKTQKGRICFMSREATKLVMWYWKKITDDSLIFATNENVTFAKSAEHMRFNDYRIKAGFTEKYDYSNRFFVSLHAFRAYFITKVSRHDPNLAKRLAGHKGYMEQYDRITTEEKLELYKKVESDLFIYEAKPESQEIQELKDKQSSLEDRLSYFEKEYKLDEEVKDPNSGLSQIIKVVPPVYETPEIAKNLQDILKKILKKASKDSERGTKAIPPNNNTRGARRSY